MKIQSEIPGVVDQSDEALAARLKLISQVCDLLRQGRDPWPAVETALVSARTDGMDSQFVHDLVDQLAVACPMLKSHLAE